MSSAPTIPFRTHLIATAIATLATAAAAQSIDAPEPARETDTPKRTETATTLDAVTVTAQKRREKARNVAVSMSVVGADQLENQHVNSLSDLAGGLPGVQIESGGTPGQTSISVRGISSLDVGSIIGTYVDDVPLGSSSSFAVSSRFLLDLLPYDVDRIEVLRGPQGTIYGAGAMGGLLKYVLIEPDLQTRSGRIGLGLSSTAGASGTGWDGRASLNVPIVRDQLALSASVSQNRVPGYIDNVVTGKNDVNRVDQKSGRVALKWQPTAGVALKLSAMQQETRADDVGVILLDAKTQQPVYGDRATGTSQEQPFHKKINLYSATLNIDLGWADLTSATSRSKTTTHTVIDDTAVYGPVFEGFGVQNGLSALFVDLDLGKVTQEFRLASKDGGQLEWLVGAFYTRETSANQQLLTAKASDGSSLPGLDPLLAVDEPTKYRETAVFGNATLKLSDAFDLTGGLRWARNEQTFSYHISGVGAAQQGLTDNGGESNESVTTWMLSPRYRLGTDNMVYGRIATGYRPGSPNLALPGVPTTVDSDTLINYELGWKALTLDRRLAIDLAVYRIDWKDIQVNNTTPAGVAYLANAGTARSKGVELGLSAKATDALRLRLNTAYSHARLTEDAPTLSGKSGDTIPGTPRWSGSIGADQQFLLGKDWFGHVGADYRWTGKRLSSFDSSPYAYTEGRYGVFNLNADISQGIWTLRAYVKNLGDQKPQLNLHYQVNAATGQVAGLQSAVLQPRTVGVQLEARF